MSALHVETPLIHIFGNSMIFGDKLDFLPTIFQPYMFYPDWFFVAWPFEFINACLNPATHPYFQGFGLAAAGFSFFFYFAGAVLAMVGISETFTKFAEVNSYPISENTIDKLHAKGLSGQIIALPFMIINGVYLLVFKILTLFFFWHVIIARVATLFITFGGRVGYQLTTLIQALLMFIMIAPGVCYMAYALYILLFKVLG
jgi:hypothetical protein